MFIGKNYDDALGFSYKQQHFPFVSYLTRLTNGVKLKNNYLVLVQTDILRR